MKLMLMVGCGLLAASPCAAAMTQMGPGSTSCAKFAEKYASSPGTFEPFFFSWAQGYMSGLNVVMAVQHEPMRDMAGIAIDQQQRIIRSYCADNPLKDYDEAARALFMQLPQLKEK